MKEVFYKAFKDTNSKKILNFIGGGAGSLIAILLLGKNLGWFTDWHDSISFGIKIVVGIYAVRYFMFLTKYSFKHLYFSYKESVYGNILLTLKEISARINWLKKQDEIGDEHFMAIMLFICQKLKEIFDKKSGSNCSISIKVGVLDSVLTMETQVKNLCRDSGASRIRDTTPYKDAKHYVAANTCFNVILGNKKGNRRDKLYYINNNIPEMDALGHYHNSSKGCYGEDGMLAYQSEMVVPIIPLHTDQEEIPEILGFLCVDCNRTNTFDEGHKYDLTILQTVANGICDIMISKKNKSIENERRNT